MKLTTAYAADWAAVYDEQGQLLAQGHSLRGLEILEKLGHTIESLEMDENDELDEFGNSFPSSLDDLKAYIERSKG